MNDWILHIDTAQDKAVVMLSREGIPRLVMQNLRPMDHASFVQPAISDILAEAELSKDAIGCIAVANGPGSYTGLRVGLASAKGLCYAWRKPLITISTLEVMANAMKLSLETDKPDPVRPVLLCPMIDARRMEVFFALYSYPAIDILIQPAAAILTRDFLSDKFAQHLVYFSGNGANKWEKICNTPHARYMHGIATEAAFAQLAQACMTDQKWANLAYAGPFYAKEFHSTAHHPN